MRKNTWTENEIEFLIKNYSIMGVDYCAKKLGYNNVKIFKMTNKLKLRLTKEIRTKNQSKNPEKCNINPNLFYSADTKEVVYLLGLIWADGFLNSSNNGRNYNLGFTMIKKDIENIKPMLDFIGKWHYYERKQAVESWKSSINVITNNKRIFDFLVQNDYDKKSYISADKILNKIPDNLKHYFFRGLIDGDGCFYYYIPEKGSTLRQFTLVSTYKQDWSYFESLCGKLNIKYKIKRIISKKSSSSIIRITNKDGIKKLGNYIYNGKEDDNIGLIRKFIKFKELINN